MKKFLCVGLVLLFIVICGCDNEALYDVSYPKPVVVLPDENTAYTINGYKDTTISTQIQNSSTTQTNSSSTSLNSSTQNNSKHNSSLVNSAYNGRYLGNINTKKLHKTTCSYVKNTKEENIEIFDNINSAEIKGYSVCKRCIGE